MGFIQNSSELATTPERKTVLHLIESSFDAIQAEHVLHQVSLKDSLLYIQNRKYDLSQFDRIFVIGFGKGSGGIAKILEDKLGHRITDGYIIDNVPTALSRIHFTQGTHPLPSEVNITFTRNVLSQMNKLTKRDLILIIICGGGSAMFEAPATVSLRTLTSTTKSLLASGANIREMNIIRKHLSLVKGGGLAKHLYPATIASLLFSDVLGNDLKVIASGPTIYDTATKEDAINILQKYHVTTVKAKDFIDLPKDKEYFTHVQNFLMVTNMTALSAMKQKAEELNLSVRIFSDRIEGDAKETGQKLIEETHQGEILLAGGETTVHVTGHGRGGRNQEVVLGSLPFVGDTTLLAAWGSDGIDFDTYAGAIGDRETVIKANKLGLDPERFLQDDNALEFFQKTGDGILTGELPSNVSDLFLVYKI